MLSIDELVEQIRRLSPEKRRQLLRRLRINGLLEFDEPVTDQDPLNIATALGLDFSDQSMPLLAPTTISATRAEDEVELDSSGPTPISEPALHLQPNEQEPELPEEELDQLRAAPIQIDLTKGNHMAPSSGKVVVGAPPSSEETAQNSDDPHAMAPVPGQGPQGLIKLIFDGGSKGNPGYGYGSYSLEWPGLPPQVVRLQHGNNVTNNEAEYDTLLKALEAIVKRFRAMGAESTSARIDIRGDSLLVINQVIGEWKCKHDRLKRRRDKIRALLDQFEYWELRHHDREYSVQILGH